MLNHVVKIPLSERVIVKVNQQPINVKLTKHTLPNCYINYIFYPISTSAKEFTRSAFNSGSVRFQYSDIKILFNTKSNAPAYRAMKKEVEKEKITFKNAI